MYKSRKQEKFFNANRAKLEKQGVDVDEWNRSSKGKKLPEAVSGLREADARARLKGKK